MKKTGIHCLISGKVQGVWFRASTQTAANALGVTGWVRNLPDGRVEVLAFGEPDKLAKLNDWLKRGPDRARVDEVCCEAASWQHYVSFEKID